MAKQAIRQIRFLGNDAFIRLGGGGETVISAEDAHLVSMWNWHQKADGYVVRKERIGGKRVTVRLHRSILSDVEMLVDHINGDLLDNRRSNLRPANRSENAANSKRPATNTSGFKGVSWHKASSKWTASISWQSVKRHIGTFDTPEAAFAAYVEASGDLHREFGRLD